MSGVFIDGGGHDSISHGGEVINHGGPGDHGIQHGHGQAGHNFLSQILGLDQQDHAHLAHHGGEGTDGQAPSQTPAWNSALQGLKLENLIAGINITPNFLLFALFASFVGWLGVIYWIRHHEPFANQVLGSSAAFAPTAAADRCLINECRQAAPLKTSAQSGIVYSPQPGQNTSAPPVGSKVNTGLSAAMSSAFGQAPCANSATAAPAQSSAIPSCAAGPPSANTGPTYAAVPEANSPVNQGLSAAMASALGTSSSITSVSGGGPAAGLANSSSYSPSYFQAPAPYPMTQQAVPQSMPVAAVGGPAAGGGSMRLFSQRRSMTAQGMDQAQRAAPQYCQAAMPASAALQYMQGQGQAPLPVPAQSVVGANTWSLANQGSGTFSADTAQFNSQFGAPFDASSAAVASSEPANGLVSGAYPVTTAQGTRLKVLTDK